MMRIFPDPDLQRRFAADGFVTAGRLEPQQLDVLRAAFDDIRPAKVSGMFSNAHEAPRDQNRRVGRLMCEMLRPTIDRSCVDYVDRGGVFVVKGAGADSVCYLHQDWTTVDETRHIGLVAWVPLVDVDADNGCLVVLPGSHRPGLFPTVRGAGYVSPHIEFDGPLRDLLVDVPLQAGEICLFAQSLFHGSYSNLTGTPRPAIYVNVLPRQAQMVHCRLTDDQCRISAIDEDFYYSGVAASLESGGPLPDLPLVDQIEPPTDNWLTAESVARRMREHCLPPT